MEHVILVDANDTPLGEMEKMEVHEKGLLHRAFSIFIFNTQGEVLLQQRALSKYHSGGLWTNTCCSHPRPGETTLEAGQRRLPEEMGFTTQLEHVGSFIYKVELNNHLTEYELDHILVGKYTNQFIPNTEEVMETKWVDLTTLVNDCKNNPDAYTEWLHIILNDHISVLKKYIAQ